MPQPTSEDSSGRTVLQTTCQICDNPLPRHASSRRVSSREELQIQWQTWMSARRLERWIWFLFVIGIVAAGVIGLARS